MVVLCSIILLAAALRLGGLARESVWTDEVITVVRAEGNGPLYLLREPAALLAYFGVIVGRTDYILRFPFAMVGVLGVAAMYRLGRELFGRPEGVISAFLLATAIFHIKWSQQIRYYSLVVLLSVAAACFLYRSLKANRTRDWIGFVFTAIWNIQNHQSGLFVLASLGVWAGLLVIWDGLNKLRSAGGAPATLTSDRAHQALRRSRFQVLRSWLSGRAVSLVVSIGAIVCLVLPSIVGSLNTVSLSAGSNREAYRPFEYEMSVGYYWNVLRDLTWDRWGYEGIKVVSMLLLLALGLTACVYHRQWRQAFLAISWVVVPIAVIQLLVVRSIVNFGATRHFMFWLPMLLLMDSRGATALGRIIGDILARFTVTSALPRGLGVGLVLFAVFLPSLRQYPIFYGFPQQEQWREAVEWIDHDHQVGDVVLFNAWFNVQCFDWYSRSSEDELHRLPFPEGTRFVDADRADELSILVEGDERVWAVFSHNRDEDREMIVDVLERTRHIVAQREYVGVEVILFALTE